MIEMRKKKWQPNGWSPEELSETRRQLSAGTVKGVPKGTDLDEFIWQKIPKSRNEIEKRNPGRQFALKDWGEQ